MRKKNDLDNIEQELATHDAAERAGGSAEHRAAGSHTRRAWATAILPVILSALAGIESEFDRQYDVWFGRAPKRPEPFEVDDQLRTARTYLVAGIGALGIEVVLSVWLLVSAVQMRVELAVIVGTTLAVGMSYAAKSMFGAIAGRLAETPRVGADRLGRAATRALVVSCVGLLVFLLGRTASGALAIFVADVLPGALAVLSLSLPLLAGACFVAAEVLTWSRRLTEQWRRVKILERRMAAHAATATQVAVTATAAPASEHAGAVDASAAPIGETSRTTGRGVGRAAAAIIWCLAGLASAGAADAAAAVPQEDAGYVFLDTSNSRAREVYLALVDELVDRVDGFASRGVASWRVVPFVDRGYYAPGAMFRLPAFAAPACGPTTALGEAAAMFTMVRTELERREREECQRGRGVAEDRHRAARRAELERLRASLQTAATHERGSCSGILDVLGRVSRMHARVVIIVSDGIESCRPLAPVAAPPAGVKVFFVLIPSRAAPGGAVPAFDRLAAMLKGVAGWMTVLAPFEVGNLQ